MIEQLLQTLKEMNNNKELWDAVASSYKNSYDALIRAGFTPDQAISIISHQGAGLKGG